NRQVTFKGWAWINYVTGCVVETIHHPDFRLIDDDQTVNPMRGVRDFFNSAIPASGTIDSLGLCGETILGDIGALQPNCKPSHGRRILLRGARLGQQAGQENEESHKEVSITQR